MGNMCDNFIIYEDNKNEFQIWQGLIGAHFTPHVDELGNLSWTNNGELPNPETVNVSGRGLTIAGIVATTGDLPETADDYVTYLVGNEPPYNGYIYNNGNWVDLGTIGASAGFGTPTATVDGNVGTPTVTITASGPNTEKVFSFAFHNLKGEPGQGVPATATPLMDGTAAVGSSDKYAREDHVHPLYNQFVRPNLLDNWYFVGGGSQQGGGQFPINQRGQTIYSNGYGIDRWTGASLDVTINSNSVTVTNNGGSQQRYKQIFTNLPNGEFTGSVLVTSVSGGVEFVMQEEGGNWQTPFNGVIPSVGLISRTGAKTVDSTYNFGFVLPVGASVTFQALKLELGSTQTLAHQENGVWVLNEIPDYQQELAKCQRYFIGFDDANNYHWVAFGTMTTTTDAIVVMPTPVTMRTTPTVSFNDVNVQGDTTIWISTTAINIQSVNVNGVALLCTINGTYTAGSAVSLAAKKIFLSADL